MIVDSTYGYLDANKFAKEQFEELADIHKGEKLSGRLIDLFLSEKTEMVIGERHYEKFIKELTVKDKVRGILSDYAQCDKTV